MENSLVTYGFNKDRERLNESNALRGSVINSAQCSGKKNHWKCNSQELFERKLVVYFVLHYFKEKVLHGNGLILKFSLLQYCAYLTRLSFFSSRT